jgi:ABC-type amino acid transport substrate-binding protein
MDAHLIARNEKEFRDLPKDPKEIIKNYDYIFSCLYKSYQCKFLRDLGAPEDRIVVLNGAIIAKQLQLLMRKRVDFFVVNSVVLQSYLKEYNVPRSAVFTIANIGKPMTSYLVGHKNFDPKIIERIRQSAKEINAKETPQN